jgi:AcrR family transcriptional regulator
MKAVAAERTRQTIAEVAWGLFVGDGTQATTVRAIDTSKRGEGLWTT